jgi:hypothetical protein
LDGWVTIPQDMMMDFQAGRTLKVSSAREINLIWGNKKYSCNLRHARPKRPYMMIRFEHNKDLLKRFRETFIYSYVVFKSQKEESDLIGDIQFRSRLEKGEREVIIFQPIDHKTIQAKVFIKINNEWNHLFQRLANENVFGWLFDSEQSYLISESAGWKSVRKFNSVKHKNNVVYYLLHSEKKLLYIGKADTFGKRVVPGRKHQGMPGDWDKFRYDVVMPEFQSLLERIEDHTIRSFAAILNNGQKYPTAALSPYTLVNTNWKKL